MKTIQFADDTTVSASGSDFGELCGIINEELKKIETWSNSNRMVLNSNKTRAVIFTNRLHDVVDGNCKISLNDVDVEFHHDVTFLGLILDDKLKFNDHISLVCTKLSKIVGILYRIRLLLPKKSLIGIYYSLFYPYLI